MMSMKKLLVVCLFSLLTYANIQPITILAKTKEDAQLFLVKAKDPSIKMALKYEISSEMKLEKINQPAKGELQPSERIITQNSITKKEQDLLARLVHAEAKGETFEGKVAVAEVVLNRVDHHQFPNSIEEVITQEGQFQPIDNGAILESAGKLDKKAVQVALAFEDPVDGALFFYNPDIADNHWQKNREVTKVIGNHQFAK
jgi:N-acetylmuramoyl-L-alanine amidase